MITIRFFLILALILCREGAGYAQSASNYGKNPVVKIATGQGDIYCEIFLDRAPVTAGNFMEYVNRGLYKDACFYRVVTPDNQPTSKIKIEVIQGGLDHCTTKKPLPPIRHESTQATGIKHLNGTLSMARNEPGTANAEFFICIINQPELDYGGRRNPDGQGFAAFGRVVKGMNTVRKIQLLPSTNQMLNISVRIKEIKVVKEY